MQQKMNPAAVASLLRERRTVHDFTSAKPPREIILDSLELARWVPNHYRTEPWRFYLLGERAAESIVNLNTELVRARKSDKVAEIKRKRWAAMPGWLVITCRRDEDPLMQQEDYAACCCAAHNIALYLWAHEIGMKWTTGAVTRDQTFFSIIGADITQEFVVGLFWYGYASSVPEQHRRNLEDVLTIVED